MEAPSEGLLLQQQVGSGQQGCRLEDHPKNQGHSQGRVVPQVRCSPWHPPVVASPSDGAIVVPALLLLVLDHTATGFGQQPQLGFC